MTLNVGTLITVVARLARAWTDSGNHGMATLSLPKFSAPPGAIESSPALQCWENRYPGFSVLVP